MEQVWAFAAIWVEHLSLGFVGSDLQVTTPSGRAPPDRSSTPLRGIMPRPDGRRCAVAQSLHQSQCGSLSSLSDQIALVHALHLDASTALDSLQNGHVLVGVAGASLRKARAIRKTTSATTRNAITTLTKVP